MIKKIVLLLVAAAVITAVAIMVTRTPEEKSVDNNWLTSDDVPVAVDQTLEPIMSEELQQFGLTYPSAVVKPVYCSEDSALRMILNDSVRIAVTTRPLSAQEIAYVKGRGLRVGQAQFAFDSFALLVNKDNPDTVISVQDIKKIVTGKIKNWKDLSVTHRSGELKLVFDHSGSSTVRYIRDSICGGAALEGNLYAQGTNKEVIEAVKNDPNAIGVVGTDWLRNSSANVLANFNHLGVKVMMVTGSKESHPQYYRPYQYYIGTGQYPLIRSVWVIVTDPRSKSYVRNLYYWLKGERGQKIICNNSQLLPYMPVQIRAVHITD